MFQTALPLGRTWTWTSSSTKVLCTVGAAAPPLPDRSAGSSQRRLPLGAQLEPATWVIACVAAKLTRIRGAQAEPVQAVCALWQPGESHSTVAITASRGYWMPPAFIQISGGSVGLQVGFQSTDLVLVFTNKDAIRGLLRGKLTLNADASAVAGPAGRTVQAGVPISFNSGIYAYSSSTGLFAGASLEDLNTGLTAFPPALYN